LADGDRLGTVIKGLTADQGDKLIPLLEQYTDKKGD
jgi:hypothetical protein